MEMKKILNIFFAVTLIVVLASCNEEDPVIEQHDGKVILSSNTVILSMHLGISSATVTIESGSGDYSVESSDETVATASLSGETITIDAVSEGVTTITVSDQEENSETISVIVLYELPTSATFNWGIEEIEFDRANGYGISILSGSVALTDLSSTHKQYLLSWEGGFSEGNKTDGKLEIVDLNNEVETIPLTSIAVIQATPSGYYLTFDDGDKSGELFFIK